MAERTTFTQQVAEKMGFANIHSRYPFHPEEAMFLREQIELTRMYAGYVLYGVRQLLSTQINHPTQREIGGFQVWQWITWSEDVYESSRLERSADDPVLRFRGHLLTIRRQLSPDGTEHWTIRTNPSPYGREVYINLDGDDQRFRAHIQSLYPNQRALHIAQQISTPVTFEGLESNLINLPDMVEKVELENGRELDSKEIANILRFIFDAVVSTHPVNPIFDRKGNYCATLQVNRQLDEIQALSVEHFVGGGNSRVKMQREQVHALRSIALSIDCVRDRNLYGQYLPLLGDYRTQYVNAIHLYEAAIENYSRQTSMR